MKLLLISLILLISCAKKADGTKSTVKIESNIIGDTISYSANGVNLKGYIAYDANINEKRPGILVIHEWWGHNKYVRKRAEMLAEMGYVAIAVDMYGNGKQATHPQDAMKFMQEVTNNISEGEARINAAIEILKQNKFVDSDRLAAIGYCFGGGVVLHAARKGFNFKAVASFHGSIATENPAKEGDIKASILVCNGAADPFVTAEQIIAFKEEMANSKADYKFINYEGAQHSFTNPDATENGKKFEMPLLYNEKADKESWQEMTNFFNDKL